MTNYESSKGTTPKRYFFWMNIPSIHMAPWIRSLAENTANEVTVVTNSLVPTSERLRGWGEVDYGKANLFTVNSWEEISQILQDSRSADVQMFAGLGVYPLITKTLKSLLRGNHGHISIFSESFDPRGIKKYIRLFRLLRYRKLARRIDTFFLTNELARNQFKLLGITDSKIAKFGYFIDAKQSVERITDSHLRIIYVGSLIARKNVVLLAKSIVSADITCSLTILGKGPQLAQIENIIGRTNKKIKVSVKQRIENKEVAKIIAEHDLLVLPSLYDGWGATVNEALMVGTRVAVSKLAGSSELVASELQGRTFMPNSIKELSDILILESSDLSLLRENRAALVHWSDEHISPYVVSEYFQSVVSRKPMQPIQRPPWTGVASSEIAS